MGGQGPQDELRRLGWGLLVYVLLLTAIGVGVVRLALNHRRFDPLTVVHLPAPPPDTAVADSSLPDSDPAIQVVADSSDSPETTESLPAPLPVSGATP